MSSTSYAPGSRVRIRGEEWVVEKVRPIEGDNGYAVHVQGLTELVRHHKAIFLDAIDTIEPLRPEHTRLVPDPSPEYRQTRLHLETLLRRTPPTDDLIHVGHQAAVDPMGYQMHPARKALAELRQRILIADGVGLGKTIEVGILLSELIKRGRGRRILVVAIRSMLAQFQQELWVRFALPLVRLDSEGIRRVHAKIPSNKNPFSYYDRAIISVDTLKNDGRYRAWLEQTRWDAIVVDECHNVANKGSQREGVARLLASTCETLILTSATPHNGRAESFANLMRMLDPTAIADETNFTHEDVNHLFVRRFKKDVEAEAGSAFTERELHRSEVFASAAEEEALAALRRLQVHNLGRERNDVDPLFPWTLVKAFLSSPHACLESIDQRSKRISDALDSSTGPHPHAARLASDADQLRTLRALVEPCTQSFRKLDELVHRLKAIGFDGSPSSPRVIVFSERIRTLSMLRDELAARLGVPAEGGPIANFDASTLSDIEQGELIESFGKKDSPLRLLLASDAASEGVNLHYYCHHLFHFDVPWSLIRLEQRMGRIDRYGQSETPHLFYLLTKTAERGADQLIVDRLLVKEEQVHKNLGEAGVILGLYDAEAEDDALTQAVAAGKTAEQAIPDTPPAPPPDSGIDLLALFAEAQAEIDKTETLAEASARPRSLFTDDYHFAKTALGAVEDHPATGEAKLVWESRDDARMLSVWAPDAFTRWREPFLPDEAIPEQNQPYRLVADRRAVMSQIRAARERSGEWPKYHLLWEQHPLLEWLLDALAAMYARNDAPVLVAPTLGTSRAVYLFNALVTNQRGQPVLAKWFGVQRSITEGPRKTATGRIDLGVSEGIVELDHLLRVTGLERGLGNPGGSPRMLDALQSFVPHAVVEARQHVMAAYEESLGPLRKRARAATRRLERWKERSEALIAARERRLGDGTGGVPAMQQKRLSDQKRHVERFVADHREWIQGLTRHGDPFVRLVAVFTGDA